MSKTFTELNLNLNIIEGLKKQNIEQMFILCLTIFNIAFTFSIDNFHERE